MKITKIPATRFRKSITTFANHQKTNGILWLLLLIALVQPTLGQSPGPLTPSFGEFSLGTTEEALKSLDEPQKLEVFPEDGILMGPTKELEYPGLQVGLHKAPGSQIFEVWKFVVTSSDWELNGGLHIGDSAAQVEKVLGVANSKRNDIDSEVWSYLLKHYDGWLWVRIKDGTLVEFSASEDWT